MHTYIRIATPRPRPIKRVFSITDDGTPLHASLPPPTTPPTRCTHEIRQIIFPKSTTTVSSPPRAAIDPHVPPSPSPASIQLLREQEQESKRVRIGDTGEVQWKRSGAGEEDTDKEREEGKQPGLGVESPGVQDQERKEGTRVAVEEESVFSNLAVFRKQLDAMMDYIGGLDSRHGKKRFHELKNHLQAASTLLNEAGKHGQPPTQSSPHPSTATRNPSRPTTTYPSSSLGKRRASPPSHDSKRARNGSAPPLSSHPLTPTKRPSSSTIDASCGPTPHDEDRPGKRARTGILARVDRPADINPTSPSAPTMSSPLRPMKRTRNGAIPAAVHSNDGASAPATAVNAAASSSIPPTATSVTGKRIKRTHLPTPKPQIIGIKRMRDEGSDHPYKTGGYTTAAAGAVVAAAGRERRKEGREKQKRVRTEYAQDGDPEIEYYEPGELLSSDDEDESDDDDEVQKEEGG